MRILKVLWIAFVATLFIYGGIVAMLSQQWAEQPKTFDELTSNVILQVLAITSMATLVVSFVLPRALLRRGQAPQVVRLAFVVRMALVEAVAIYGVVGAIIVPDARVFYAFGGVALVVMLLSYPSDEPFASTMEV